MMTIRLSHAAAPAAAFLLATGAALAAPAPVQLHWVNQPAAGVAAGASWGVPWPQGAVARDATFSLTDAAGRALPVQTWPLAYWPDGSLKWSGFATVAPAGLDGELTLAPGTAAAGTLKVAQDGKTVVLGTTSGSFKGQANAKALILAVTPTINP